MCCKSRLAAESSASFCAIGSQSIFDQFDEACVDFGLGTIRDDEALPLAGASQLRFDRQGDGVDIRPLAPSSRFQRRGDFRAVQPDVDPIGRNGYPFDNCPGRGFSSRRAAWRAIAWKA